MSRPRFAPFLLALVLPLACAAPVSAASKPAVFATDGVAIQGYDPVAYFTRKKPVEGSARYTYRWKGATWRFASAANRDAFKANPARYAPQYGGYCAYAMSEDAVAPTDPAAWTVYKGKLYLNYSRSVRSLWRRDRDRRIGDADRNWPGVLNK